MDINIWYQNLEDHQTSTILMAEIWKACNCLILSLAADNVCPLLYVFFWVYPRRPFELCRRFGVFTSSPRRWNRQRIPKCRQSSNGRRGYTQKKTYNIQNPTKAWNQDMSTMFADNTHLWCSNITQLMSEVRGTWNLHIMNLNSTVCMVERDEYWFKFRETIRFEHIGNVEQVNVNDAWTGRL